MAGRRRFNLLDFARNRLLYADEESTPTQFMKNLIAIISLIILLIAELLLGNERQGPVMV
jgi:hypothetical protein